MGWVHWGTNGYGSHWMMIVLALLAAAAVSYLLLILPTQWLKVEHVDWRPAGGCAISASAVKLLQVSDIHIERNRALSSLIRVIGAEQPDYILLTGDYLDSFAPFSRLERLLADIESFHIPTFAVLGNHDYLLEDDIPELVDLFQSKGVRVLRNETVNLPEFYLIGIDDYSSGEADVERPFVGLPYDKPRVIMAHDGSVIMDIHEPFDALVSGHFHGRQINLPFLYQLQPMGPLPAQGMYKGRHQTPYGPIYISKGIGQSGVNLRLFVRSEITLHTL